jgi:hypothetical protein
MMRRLGLALAGLLLTAAPAFAETADDGKHLGVASCAGNNCHGAAKPVAGVRIPQNEYLIWKQKDKHAIAFAVLREPRALRIAKNLGLPDAEHQALCLDCHADNVPAARRGPQFDVADGVGCEACHGGAEGWLGVHLSGVGHAANLAAGMYPTDQPLARAERCLSCHVGDDKRFVTHRLMGAGHPPMPFELDTYTAIEPAHFVVDRSYVERKGQPNDIKIWAIGQAVDVKARMDLILDPKNAPKGPTDFELSLFDCQACHHATQHLQWRQRGSTGLDPGRIKLYDATLIMLRVAARRVAPEAAAALSANMLALHHAAGENWDAVRRQATAVRQAVETLIPALAAHDLDADDAKALAQAVIAEAVDGGELDCSAAQQEVMALGSIVAEMKSLGMADAKQLAAINQAMDGLYAAVADDQAYRPDIYVEALRRLQAALPS